MDKMDDLNSLIADEQKDSLGAPRVLRTTDPDVFSDPESARVRARQLGCIGIRRYNNRQGGESWMPCSNESDFRKYNGMGPSGRRFRRQQLEQDVREIIGRSRKKEDFTEEVAEKSSDSKASNYTKPQLRENLKRRIMAGDRGGAPGQWSARKAQLLAQAYKKAGGGYKSGKRSETQRSLKKWTGEKWRTSDGKRARRGGATRRYLPSSAWSKLSPGQIRATNRKKMEASKRGEQFVSNTEAAKNARKRSVRGYKHIEFYEELDVKALPGRIGGQLGRALRPGGGGGTGGRQARRSIGKLNRNVVISGDQNPMTRPDADGDGILFDGTWREMPDPTPFSDFTVAGKLRRRAMNLPESKPAPEKPAREVVRGEKKPEAPLKRAGAEVAEEVTKPKKLNIRPFKETEIRKPIAAPATPPSSPPDDPWEKYRDNFDGANNARLNRELYKLSESLSGNISEIAKNTGLFKDQINEAVRKHRSTRKRNNDSFKNNFPATFAGINNFGSVREEALEAIAEGKIKNWDDLIRWSFNDPELRKNRLTERATNDLFRAFKNGKAPDDDSSTILGFKPSKRGSGDRIRTFADSNNLPKDFVTLGFEARRAIDSSISPSSVAERAVDRNRSRMQRLSRPNESVLRDFDKYSAGISGRMAGTPPGGMSDADRNAWKQTQWKKKKLSELGMESGLELNSPTLKAKLDEGDDLADGLTGIMNLSDTEAAKLWDDVSNEFRAAGRSMPAYRRADAPLAPDELASAATVKRPLVKSFLDEYKKYKPNGNFARLDPDRMSDSEIEDLFNAFIVPELVDPDRPDAQEIIRAASLLETQDRMSMADEMSFGLGEEYMTLDFRRKVAERRLREAGMTMDDPGFWDNLDNILNDPNAPIDRGNDGINPPPIDRRSASEITDPDDFLAWLSNGGGSSGGGGIIEGPNGPMDEDGWVQWGRRIFDDMNDAGEKYVSGESYIGKGLDELEAEAKEWNIIGYEQGWLEMPPNVRIFTDPDTGEKVIEMDFDKPGADDIINTEAGPSISRGGKNLEWYEDEFGYLDTDDVWQEDPAAAGVDPNDPSTWANLEENTAEDGSLLPLNTENLPPELWSIFTQRDWYDIQDTHVAQRYTAVPPELTDPKRRLGGRTSRGIQADGKPFSDVTVPMDIEWDMLLPAFEEAYGPFPRRADGSIDTSALPSGTYAAAGTGVARGNPFADFSADQSAKKFRDAANEQKDHLLGDVAQSASKEGSREFRARLWALFQSGQDPEEIAHDEIILGWFEQDNSGRFVGHSGPHLVTQALKKHAVEMNIPDSQFKQLEQVAKTGFQNRYATHRKKVLDRVRDSIRQRVLPAGGRSPSQEAIAEIDFRITKWNEFKEKMAKAYDQSRAQEAGLRYMIVSMLATRPLPEQRRQIGFDEMGNPIFSNGWDPATESLSRYKNRIRRWNREFIGYIERDESGEIVYERKGIVQQMTEQLRMLTLREGRDGMSGMSAFVVGGGRGNPGLADAQISALEEVKREMQSLQQEAGRLGVSGFMRSGNSIIDETQERAAVAGKNMALGRYRRKSPNLLRNYDSPDFDVNKKVRNAFSGTAKSVKNLIDGENNKPQKLSETRAFAYLTPREKNLVRAIDAVPQAHLYLTPNPIKRNREEVGDMPDERQSLLNRLSNTPAQPLNISYGISGFMGGPNPATRGSRLRERNSFRRGRYRNIEGIEKPKYRLEIQEREDTIFGKGKGLYVVDNASGNVIDGPFDTPQIAMKVMSDVSSNQWPEPWLQDPLLRDAILRAGMSETTHKFHTSDTIKMSDILSSSNGWVYKKDDGTMQEVADSVFLRRNKETGLMEVMMVQRGDGPHIGDETGAWVLPGGFRDADENRNDTAARELLEETGIDVSSMNLNRRNMGNIEARDWDIRWSGGVSVDGQKFRVPDDYEDAIDFAAGDDAKKAQWISVDDIANGQFPVGFGHLAWIRLAMTDEIEGSDDSVIKRLEALERVGRSRNQELIYYANLRRKRHNAGVRKRNQEIQKLNRGKPESEKQPLEKVVPLFDLKALGEPSTIYSHYDPDAYLGIWARNAARAASGLPPMNPAEEKRHKDNSGEIVRPGVSAKMTSRSDVSRMGTGDITRRSAYLASNGNSVDEIVSKLKDVDPYITPEIVRKSLKSIGVNPSDTPNVLSDTERAIYMATAHDRMSIAQAAKKFKVSQDEIFNIQKKYQSVLEDREPSINKIYRELLSDNSPLKRQDTANMMRRLDGASIDEMASLLNMDEIKYRSYEDKLFDAVRKSNPAKFMSKTKHINNMQQHKADQMIYMMLNHEDRNALSVAKSLGITPDLVNSRANRYQKWLDSSRQIPRIALRSTIAEFGDAVLSSGELQMMRRLADGESITDFAERRKIAPRRAMHMVNKAMDKLEKASYTNTGKWSRKNNVLESMPKQWMNPVFTRDMGRETFTGVSGRITNSTAKNVKEANEWNAKYRSYATDDLETLRKKALEAVKIRRENTADAVLGFVFGDFDADSNLTLATGFYIRKKIEQAELNAASHLRKEFFESGKIAPPDATARAINNAVSELSKELWMKKDRVRQHLDFIDSLDEVGYPWRSWDKSEWARHKNPVDLMDKYEIWTDEGQQKYVDDGFYLPITGNELEAFIAMANDQSGVSGRMSSLNTSRNSGEKMIGEQRHVWDGNQWIPDYSDMDNILRRPFEEVSNSEMLGKWSIDKNGNFKDNLNGNILQNPIGLNGENWNGVSGKMAKKNPEVQKKIKNVVKLRKQGKTNRQIADELGLSLGQVGQYIVQARQQGIDLPDVRGGTVEATEARIQAVRQLQMQGIRNTREIAEKLGITPAQVITAKAQGGKAATKKRLADRKAGAKRRTAKAAAKAKTKKKVNNSSGGISGRMSAMPPLDDTLEKRLPGFDPDSLPSDYDASFLTATNPRSTLSWYRAQKGEPFVPVTATFGGTTDIVDWRHDDVYMPIVQALVNAIKGRTSKKQFISVGGAPGSGKSTDRKSGRNGIPSPDDALHLDADEIKTLIPEARALHGAGNLDWANTVHEESRIIVDMALQQGIKDGHSVVYDSTGQFNSGFGTLQAARDNGYEVVAHYNVALPDQLEAARLKRQQTDPRNIPSSLVPSVIATNRSIMPKVADFADEFYLWDADNTTGTRTLLARKTKGGKLEVLDVRAYVHADFDDAGQKINKGGRPDIKIAQRGIPKDSAQGDILSDYDKGMTVSEIAKARKISEAYVFKTVTENVIDPNMKGYRPTTPQPKKEVEKFVTDEELSGAWDSLSDGDKQLVRDVINKVPGAMDEFNETTIPIDMLIWGAQNGVSGKMGAPKRFAERDASIIEQYKAGKSLAEMASAAGITQNAVTQVLNMARKRGIIGKPRSGVVRSEDIPRNQQIVELYESGKGYTEIAKELGLTTSVVYNAVLKSGKMKPIEKRRGQSGNGVSGRMAMPADGVFKKYKSPEAKANRPTFRGKPWDDVEESLGGLPFPFKSQARQFDRKGPPGLSYFKGTGNGLKPGQWVDCLLWRNEKGILKGIVYHYPQDLPLEKKGNMNIFISPDSKRQGIASKLVTEAIERYNVDLRKQRYSEEGAAFINSFVRNLPENAGGVSGRMAAISEERKKEIDEYIKNNPDKADRYIGRKFGVSASSVSKRRDSLGMPPATKKKISPKQISEIDEYIRNNPDEPMKTTAKKLNRSSALIAARRLALGFDRANMGPKTREEQIKIDEYLKNNPDHSDNHVARKLGITSNTVKLRRAALGLQAPKRDIGLIQRLSAEKISAIDAEIKRDPDQFTKAIAKKLGVPPMSVSARRDVLNLPGPVKGGQPVTEQKDREIKEYIKNNPDESNVSIAKKFGVSSPTIANKRRSLDLVVFPTAKRREELVGNLTGPPRIPKETEDRIVREYLNGLNVIKISTKLKVSKSSVEKILKERGVSRRTPKTEKPEEEK